MREEINAVVRRGLADEGVLGRRGIDIGRLVDRRLTRMHTADRKRAFTWLNPVATPPPRPPPQIRVPGADARGDPAGDRQIARPQRHRDHANYADLARNSMVKS